MVVCWLTINRLAFIKGAMPPLTTENAPSMPSVVALMVIFYVATLLETKIGNIIFSPNVNEIIARTTSFELEYALFFGATFYLLPAERMSRYILYNTLRLQKLLHLLTKLLYAICILGTFL